MAQQFYAENGYYLAKGVFSPEEIKTLEKDFDKIVQQLLQSKESINARWGGPNMKRDEDESFAGHPVDTEVIHTHQVQLYSSNWTQALLNEKLLDVAQNLLQDGVILHHTKLFQKPPKRGSAFTMHQDWSYFPTEKDSMLAAIIHVSEATEEMGCLSVYPGSHKLGRVPETSGWTDNAVLKDYPLSKALALPAEPGDVLFFSYFLFHGSKPNISSKERKTVLVQLYGASDRVESGNQHPNSRLVLRGWNPHMTRNQANTFS